MEGNAEIQQSKGGLVHFYLHHVILSNYNYISGKISEISSLCNNFLWPWYDKREEGIVNDILKIFATHIKP